MSDFKRAIPTVLLHEGGFVDNKNDAGGTTNYGISVRFLKDHPDDGDYNHDGIVDAKDIKMMTQDQACLIYEKYFWDANSYTKITDQTIATKIFDFSVNMGASRSHRIVQAAVNKVLNLSLGVDGVLGQQSINAINSGITDKDKQALITAISNGALAFYQNLAYRDSSQSQFLNGWKNRAYSISKVNQIT